MNVNTNNDYDEWYEEFEEINHKKIVDYCEKYPFLVRDREMETYHESITNQNINGVHDDLLYPFWGYVGDRAHNSSHKNGSLLWNLIFEHKAKQESTTSNNFFTRTKFIQNNINYSSIKNGKQVEEDKFIEQSEPPVQQNTKKEKGPFKIIRK